MSIANEELCLLAQKGKKEALDMLYERSQGLINKICRKAAKHFDIEFEETVQEAAFGFNNAVTEFNCINGIKFTTFLSKCVCNSVIEYAKREKKQKSKFPILTYTETNTESYLTSNINPVDSPDAKLYPIETNEHSINSEEVFFQKYKEKTVRDAILSLSERHRQYISFRFGLVEHGKSETAAHFGISAKEAAKIENEALKQLRKYCVPFFEYGVNSEINILDGKQFESRFNNSTQFCGMFFHLVSENNAGSKCIYSFAITNISDEEIKGEMYVDFEETTFEIRSVSADMTNQISACIQRIFQSLIYNYPLSGRLPNGMIIVEKYT